MSESVKKYRSTLKSEGGKLHSCSNFCDQHWSEWLRMMLIHNPIGQYVEFTDDTKGEKKIFMSGVITRIAIKVGGLWTWDGKSTYWESFNRGLGVYEQRSVEEIIKMACQDLSKLSIGVSISDTRKNMEIPNWDRIAYTGLTENKLWSGKYRLYRTHYGEYLTIRILPPCTRWVRSIVSPSPLGQRVTFHPTTSEGADVEDKGQSWSGIVTGIQIENVDNGDTWIFDEKNNLWVADHSLSGNLSVGDHPSTSKYGPRILTMSEMSVVACEDLQYYIPVLLVHVDTIPESRNMDDFMDEAADKSFKGEIPGNPFWTAIYVPREFKDGIMPMGKSF